ncbi:glycerophosphotransferase [soil metagenome]
MKKIAFLALAQAHQLFHWLPAALCLARDGDMQVSILSPSAKLRTLIARHDPDGLLHHISLRRPTLRSDSLFCMPPRQATLLLNYPTIAAFDYIVTTEITSSALRNVPGFRSRMILIKHGAGDREGGYKQRHANFDLTLVAGEKDKTRMIARGLVTPDNCHVAGCAKMELMAPREDFFGNGLPTILYNPHFDQRLSSWRRHGGAILRCLESLNGFNVIIAPHVRLAETARPIRSDAPHILVDMGSDRSIDMSYTNSADIYLGDVSSQVYEFILTPRPCLFLNLDHIDYAAQDCFAHWRLGQVVDDLAELPIALGRAKAIQPSYATLQADAAGHSISMTPTPASRRQADYIRAFMDDDVRKKGATGNRA